MMMNFAGNFSISEATPPLLGVFRHRPASVLQPFEEWLGREVQVAVDFLGRDTWPALTNTTWVLTTWGQWVMAKPGRKVSLAYPLYPSGAGFTLKMVADGAADEHYRRLADNLVAHGLADAFMRPQWEMDLPGMFWNATPGSGREAVHAAAWRRHVDVMREHPDGRWTWEQVTGLGWRSRDYLEAIWPGDEYVDRVGMDFYDADFFAYADGYPYPANADAAARLRRQQEWWNRYSWWLYTMRDFAAAHNKPLCIPEWSVMLRLETDPAKGGGDNPHFIERMHEFITNPENRVVWHGLFDARQSAVDMQLCESTTMPNAAAAFRRLFGHNGRVINARLVL
jgi:hypothetical protein